MQAPHLLLKKRDLGIAQLARDGDIALKKRSRAATRTLAEHGRSGTGCISFDRAAIDSNAYNASSGLAASKYRDAAVAIALDASVGIADTNDASSSAGAKTNDTIAAGGVRSRNRRDTLNC